MTEPVIGQGDAVTAYVEWLEGDSAIVEALARDVDEDSGVFGYELPDSEAGRMPRTAIVVSDAGGFNQGLPEAIDRGRFDIRSYGATPDQAKRIAVLVRLRLKALTRWTSSLGIVIHGPRPAGGYIPLREQSGGWPLVLRSYTGLYDDTQAAV